MQRQRNEEEMRVVAYVKQMSLDQLMRPFDPIELAAELNIQNPIIIMMVEKWISIRR